MVTPGTVISSGKLPLIIGICWLLLGAVFFFCFSFWSALSLSLFPPWVLVWFVAGLVIFVTLWLLVRRLDSERELLTNRLFSTEARFRAESDRLDRTSQALMENASRLSSFIDSSQDGIILFDTTGVLEFMSVQSQRMFGFEPREYIGQSLRLLCPQPLSETTDSEIATFLQSRQELFIGQCHEVTALRKDGTEFLMDVTISHSELDEGRPGFIALVRDLSQSRQQEFQFRQFRQAVEQSPVSVVITDLAGRIEYVNPKFTQATGYLPEEVRGKNPRLLNSGKTPVAVYTEMWETLKNGQVWTGEFINRKKTGDLYYEAASISPVHDHHGKPLFYVAVKEDVTQKRLAEEALRESQRFIRSTLDSLEDQIAIFDVDGHLIDANTSWKTFHSGSENAPGESPAVLDDFLRQAASNSETLAKARQAIREIMERKRDRFAFESEFATPPRWFRLEITPFQGEGPMRIVFVQRDVDAHQKAMRALIKGKEEAESANRAKSVFLATMSHELRTPLNSILGFSDLLQGRFGELNEKQKSYVGAIANAGKHLLDLINDLLDMAKIESGKITLFPAPLSLREIVDGLVLLVQPSVQEKKLVISISIDKESDTVFADAARTKQVILNLLSNAIKFTPIEGCISIETRLIDPADVFVQISDTGIGIEAEDQRKIFTSFFQSRVTQKGQFGGTGIGLALCKRLVELQEGRIGFESYPGRGSHFWFTLPRQAPIAASPTVVAAESAFGYFPDVRVLVADSEEGSLEAIQELLHLSGCRVDVARNARQACDLAFAQPPDLIILSLHLPDQEGWTIAANLRTTPDTTGVPLVGLTTDLTPSLQEKAKQAGFSAIFPKPLPLPELARFLKELFAGQERKPLK